MTLRTRLILSILVSFTVLAGTIIATHLSSKQFDNQRFLETTQSATVVLWNKIVDSQLDQMENGMPGLTRDRGLLKALKAEDNTALKQAVEATFNRLSSSGVLTALQIANNQGQIIYDTDGIAGNQSALATDAAKQGKIFRGLGQGGNDSANIQLAFPLYNRGKPVGVGIFVRSLDAAVKDLKNTDHTEVSVLGKDRTERFATQPDFFALFSQNAREIDSASASVVAQGDRVFTLSRVPLVVYSGAKIGTLVNIKDYTRKLYTTAGN